jgi:hypothetical protein
MALERIDALLDQSRPLDRHSEPDLSFRDDAMSSRSALENPTGLDNGAAAGKHVSATSSGRRRVRGKRAEAAETVPAAENEPAAKRQNVCIREISSLPSVTAETPSVAALAGNIPAFPTGLGDPSSAGLADALRLLVGREGEQRVQKLFADCKVLEE